MNEYVKILLGATAVGATATMVSNQLGLTDSDDAKSSVRLGSSGRKISVLPKEVHVLETLETSFKFDDVVGPCHCRDWRRGLARRALCVVGQPQSDHRHA